MQRHHIKKIDNYVLEAKIGQGQFGEVFRAKHLDSGELFAVKVLNKALYKDNKLMRRQLKLETQIMNQVSHPNLMRLHKSFETARNYYLVLDYCREGDLQQFMATRKVRHFSEREAIYILSQIRDGFGRLRSMHVMHRDLKLENIFVHGPRVVLGDFGAAKVVKEMTSTTVGTPLNMAPEVLQGSDYDHKSDLWSIGVLFYQLVVGKPPFFAFSIGELRAKILKHSGQNLRFRDKTHLCPRVKDFLRAVLEPDPLRRMTWDRFVAHPIFGDAHLATCDSIASCRIGAYLPRDSPRQGPSSARGTSQEPL